MRVMEQVENIREIGVRSEERASKWYSFLENETNWHPLVQNKATRSYDTVIAVKGDLEAIAKVKKAALKSGIDIGEWLRRVEKYNLCQENTNFPAIEDAEIEKLKDFLKNRAN